MTSHFDSLINNKYAYTVQKAGAGRKMEIEAVENLSDGSLHLSPASARFHKQPKVKGKFPFDLLQIQTRLRLLFAFLSLIAHVIITKLFFSNFFLSNVRVDTRLLIQLNTKLEFRRFCALKVFIAFDFAARMLIFIITRSIETLW